MVLHQIDRAMRPLVLLTKYRAIVLLFAIASSAHAQTRTVDFELVPAMANTSGMLVPANSQLRDQYLASHHVRFSSSAPFVSVVTLGPNHAVSGINGIGGATSDGRLSYAQANPIRGQFLQADGALPSLTTFVSVRGDLQFGGGSKTLRVFGVDGGLLGQSTRANSDLAPVRVDAPGIHSFEIIGNASGDIAFDDIQFNEPSPCVSVYTSPASVAVCPSGQANLAVVVTGVGVISYRWRIESPAGSGAFIDISSSPFVEPATGLKFDVLEESSTTNVLQIANIQLGSHAESLLFLCRASNSCGTVDSDAARAVVCQPDFTCDGQVDDVDFVVFVAAYNILDCADPLMPAICSADLNGDGFVEDSDFVLFVAAYNALGCVAP